MGKVNFGCIESPSGKWVPMIQFESQGELFAHFVSSLAFDTADDAREFIMGIEKILRGPRKDFVYDRNGNARGMI